MNEFEAVALLQNKKFAALCIDSRKIQAGDVFIALPGQKTDGRDYISKAIANGASAIVYESENARILHTDNIIYIPIANLVTKISMLAAQYYKNPSNDMHIAAVTGTNGKTSITHYIAQLLQANKIPCAVMGTVGNGIYPKLQAADLTTSDCCSIQREFANFKQHGVKFIAMEASSHALDQNRLKDTYIDSAIFTNLSQDHLDYHTDMQDYFMAKARLFNEFSPKNCIINLDDEYGKKLLKHILPSTNLLTYSLNNHNADLFLDHDVLHSPWGRVKLAINLLGDFNKSNILAAFAFCSIHGVRVEDLGLQAIDLKPVSGRMELIAQDEIIAPKIIVDYAHTPAAIEQVLQSLRVYKPRKIYCIVGCGGDRDRTKRKLMMQACMNNSDEIIITQDNPRTEDPMQIVNDMLQGITLTNNISIELDRAKAIQKAIGAADIDDIVLIAGKGHEDYQIIGTTKFPFSDQRIAKQALMQRNICKELR